MRVPTILLAATLAALPAVAERADREKEIVIGADRLIADDAKKVSTFEGGVIVTQGTMRITANKVTVKEDAQRNKFYVASGSPVSFRQKRDNVDEWVEGFAERAEFDDRADVLKLFNRARVKSNLNEITGEFISYDMRRELAEVTGAAPGTVAPAGTGRVKVIILPSKTRPAEDEAAQKAPVAPLKLKSDGGGR